MGLLSCAAPAVPVASNLTADVTASLYIGQSFTVVAPGPVNNVVFNFFRNAPPTIPQAAGIGYLFSAAYSGSPNGLAAATTNLLGTAVASASHYTFAPSLTLQPGVQYFFYADTLQAHGADALGSYTGGQLFSSGMNAATNFSAFPSNDTAFLVDATLVAAGAPELDPAASSVPMVALMCLWGLAGRRQRKIPAAHAVR